MSTQCRFCGAAVRPDSMFCPACGQLVGASAGPVPPPFPGVAAPEHAPVAPAPPGEIAPVPLPVPRRPATPEPAANEPGAPAQPAPAAPAPPAPEPATPAPAEAPTPAAHGTLVLVLPGGSAVPVDRMLVLGRAPESGSAGHGGTAVRVDDPGRSMSRVHLIVTPSAFGASAVDPGSANGTQLTRDGARYQLVAGEACDLVRGDRLELGDAVVTVA